MGEAPASGLKLQASSRRTQNRFACRNDVESQGFDLESALWRTAEDEDRPGGGPLDRPPGRPLDRPGDGSLDGSGGGSRGGSLHGLGGGSLDRLLDRPLDRPLYHTGGVPKSSCKLSFGWRISVAQLGLSVVGNILRQLDLIANCKVQTAKCEVAEGLQLTTKCAFAVCTTIMVLAREATSSQVDALRITPETYSEKWVENY